MHQRRHRHGRRMEINREDYLKAIYKLQTKNNRSVSVKELSEFLHISKPSVSEMVRKLAGDKLVVFKKYGKVFLTPKGIIEAEKILKKHRLIETFLHEMLRIKKEDVHEEADKLEHALSEKVTENIDEMLKFPKKDVCGDEIPRSIDKKIVRLCDVCANRKAEIVFSKVDDDKVCDRLNSLGLLPSCDIFIVRKIKDGPLILKVKKSKIMLDDDICSHIYVRCHD